MCFQKREGGNLKEDNKGVTNGGHSLEGEEEGGAEGRTLGRGRLQARNQAPHHSTQVLG